MEKTLRKVTVNEIINQATDELTRLGCSPITIRQYQNTWKRLEKYSSEHSNSEFSEQMGAAFLKDVFNWPSGEKNTKQMVHAARAVRVLGDMQLHGLILRNKRVSAPKKENNFMDVLHQFKTHGAAKLSPKSIIRIEQVLDKLFDYLLAQGVNDCGSISHSHIDGFAGSLSGYAKKTLALSMYSLRVFLEFLYTKGLLETDLRKAVPTITHVNRRNIPATWSKEETDKILNAIDRANPCGKRDYAILLAIAKLGLRQSDIVGLRFDNINWVKCTLTIIQSKTRHPLVLPLPEDVGSAIIDYLKNGRAPSAEPYVFIKHVYPFDKMQTVYMLLDKYVRLAVIKRKSGQPKGPHTLRHSLAGRMLEKRIPIETISAVLGHKSTNSTLDYLKIDLSSLAECAVDPEGVLINE